MGEGVWNLGMGMGMGFIRCFGIGCFAGDFAIGMLFFLEGYIVELNKIIYPS